MSKIVRLTESDLIRLVKRVVKEQSEQISKGNPKWELFKKELGPLSHKTIRMADDDVSFNWGDFSGPGYKVGFKISKKGDLYGFTKDLKKAEILKNLISRSGLPIEADEYQGKFTFELPNKVLYSSDPSKVISFVKELIKNLR